MTDLERALRETLADPPVHVRENRYAADDIRLRVEQRRSRQKRTATGIGVAAAIAAAIAVPVATGVDLGTHSRTSSDGAAVSAQQDSNGGRAATPDARLQPPKAVRTAAQALVRDYGRPSGPVQWVRTTPEKWAKLLHSRTPNSAAQTTFYVLQFRHFTCTGASCAADAQGYGPDTAMVATLNQDGTRGQVTFVPAYRLSTLGPVHTFTIR